MTKPLDRVHPLPPLTYLRTFEALSRHLNFTRASREIGITQASVSQQIKALEQWLGTLLVVRSKRGCELTSAGALLADTLQRAFRDVGSVVREIKGSEEVNFRIGVLPSFASSWLGPRMGEFRSANPDLSVRMILSSLNDVSWIECDVAILAGKRPWKDLEAIELLPMTFTPMCSPSLLKGYTPLGSLEQMLMLPLIARKDVWWRLWLDAAGRPDLSVPCGRDIAFGAQHMEAEAAISGEGIALLTPALFTEEIKSGTLVRLTEVSATDGRGYWLVYPRERRNSQNIRRFRNWVENEATSSKRSAGAEPS